MDEKHVVTCFLEHEGKVAILRRSQKVGTYKGRWAGVSGYLEERNTPYEQALKEMREEAGLRGDDIKLVKEGELLGITDDELDRKWVVHPYRFRVLNPEQIKIDWEHTGMKWIDPEDIGKYETVPNLAQTWDRVK